MSLLLQKLILGSGLSEHSIWRVIETAPARYKEYSIPKKSGGVRKLAQPAKEVKLLQRILMKEILEKLPVHGAATAYRKGATIRNNALQHAGSTQILKMDFKEFFPSITPTDWIRYCLKSKCLTDRIDIQISVQLLFYKPKGQNNLRLSIGAPSSPLLSNILMHDFDTILSQKLLKDKVIYTRYADDLTFSAPRTGYLTVVRRAVREAMSEIDFPSLQINSEKTTYVTKKYKRSVTGLVLANDGRVTIGRDKKRQIRAAICNYRRGNVPFEKVKWLAGMIAYIKSAEPDYFNLLLKTNGPDTLRKILRHVLK